MMSNRIYPEPIVGALIFNHNKEILLLKSSKWRDLYVVPGGHVELGESLTKALEREVKEETGLDIFEIKFAGINEMIFDPIYLSEKHFIFVNFTCKTNSIAITLNSEAEDFIWVKPEASLDLAIEPYSMNFIMSLI